MKNIFTQLSNGVKVSVLYHCCLSVKKKLSMNQTCCNTFLRLCCAKFLAVFSFCGANENGNMCVFRTSCLQAKRTHRISKQYLILIVEIYASLGYYQNTFCSFPWAEWPAVHNLKFNTVDPQGCPENFSHSRRKTVKSIYHCKANKM